MDPLKLLEDEIEYEFEIRKIVQATGKTRALREILKQEFSCQREVPMSSHRDPSSEIEICRQKLSVIESHLQKPSTHLNYNELSTIDSRLIHILNRLERVRDASKEQLCVKDELIRKCNQLDELASLSRVKLQHSQESKSNQQESKEEGATGGQVNVSNDTQQGKRTGTIPKHNTESRLLEQTISQNRETMSVMQNFIHQQQSYNTQMLHMQQQMLALMSEMRSPTNSHVQPSPPPLSLSQVPTPNFAQRAENHRRTSSVPKWDIEKFSGEKRFPSVNEFITKVEMYAESDQLSEAGLAQSAVHLFEGTALHWYSGLHQQLLSIEPALRWREIKKHLKKDFLPADYDFRLKSQIENRLQGPDEPFSVYIASMQFLFAQMATQYEDAEKLQMIRRNMRPSYLSQLTFETIRSIEELKNKCREIDTTETLVKRHTKMFPIPYAEPSFQYRSKRLFTNHRQEQLEEYHAEEGTDEDETVEAIATAPKTFSETEKEKRRIRPKRRECYNCKEEGHFFKNCPKKQTKEFCTRCGCPDVKASDCKKCRTPLGN